MARVYVQVQNALVPRPFRRNAAAINRPGTRAKPYVARPTTGSWEGTPSAAFEDILCGLVCGSLRLPK
jgi:hypothetical protein